jgi:MOSC domain-containing protein
MGRMAEGIGSIAGLWRYPVKSMGGEACAAVEAGERGLAGDRTWAVLDVESGKVVSAKRPKLWGAMLECSAAYAEEPSPDGPAAPVRITLPDGRETGTDDPDRDRLLSEALGREVTMESRAPEGATYDIRAADAQGLEVEEPERLTESPVGMFAPPGTFFDTSTLHVLANTSLDGLAAAHPDGEWDTRRFRPNVLVEVDGSERDAEFVENTWVGHLLELGAAARAAVLAPMPRCVMTTLPQGDLARDPLILRTLADRNRQSLADAGVFACVGALTNVTAPGRVTTGDPVSLGAAL